MRCAPRFQRARESRAAHPGGRARAAIQMPENSLRGASGRPTTGIIARRAPILQSTANLRQGHLTIRTRWRVRGLTALGATALVEDALDLHAAAVVVSHQVIDGPAHVFLAALLARLVLVGQVGAV